MNKKLYVICTLLLCTLLSACDSEDKRPSGEATYREHFVTHYREPSAVEVIPSQTDTSLIFRLRFTGKDIDKSTDLQTYLKYATQYGDLHFNRKVANIPVVVLAEPLRAVKITCSRDWSDSLPKGADLSSVATIQGWSVFDFLQSGYINNWQKGFALPLQEQASYSNKLLLKLYGTDENRIELHRLPHTKGSHTFTIVLQLATVTLTKEVTVDIK